MYSKCNTTHIEQACLQPGRAAFGDAQRAKEIDFLHEGIHRSPKVKGGAWIFWVKTDG